MKPAAPPMIPTPSISGRLEKPTLADVRRSVLYTALFNTAIAVLLTTIGFGHSFWHTLAFSQLIGMTICAFVLAAWRAAIARATTARMAILALALIAGALVGTTLGTVILNLPDGIFAIRNRLIWQVSGISILFGVIITHFFYTREQLAESARLTETERMLRLSSEKLALEADLKRLQAQIEPHFLFNTLSTILSLMDSDPPRARAMQLDLMQYLRTTLGRSQAGETTLAQEIDRVRAYLDIFKIRMADRLRYEILVPAPLRELTLPPMLIQPIVENALVHGLEPKLDGGQVRISATERNGFLVIAVADTGQGLDPHRGPGVGLTNVKERLATLYGSNGRLTINENQPNGVTAEIQIPLAPDVM